MTLVKILLIILGTASLIIGIIGIFIPGLPTTPFLLLTLGLYLRSSKKLYWALIDNKYIGSYVLKYQSNKGMALRTKIYTITLMWLMIVITCLFFITPLWLILFILILGGIGTIVMGFVIPTVNKY